VDGSATRPGRAVAVDVSALYKKQEINLGTKKGTFNAGLNFSNLGNKVTYTATNSATNVSNFLPMNMRLGVGLDINMDEYNKLGIYGEANKLLVPTPPVYKLDVNGNVIKDGNGGYEIEYGKNPNKGVASGLFSSFNDAPGGSKEEMHEIIYTTGIEYWYNKMFALRTGYFFEHPTKGDRKYLTLGASLKYNVFQIDFAYLVPKNQNNPLKNTLRIGLSFEFDATKKADDIAE
jgi:hypothetical protein